MNTMEKRKAEPKFRLSERMGRTMGFEPTATRATI